MNIKPTVMSKTMTQPIQNREVIKHLISLPDPRDRLFFGLSLFTALRVGEVLETKWGHLLDYDLPRVREKGIFTQLKKRGTKPASRKILLHPELRGIIWDVWLESGQPPAGVYCIRAKRGRRGHNPMTRQSVNKMIKKYCNLYGIKTQGNKSSHMLRKTMARTFFESSVAAGDPDALEMTAQMLGHGSTVSTLRYLGITQDTVDSRIGNVDYGAYVPSSLWHMLQTSHPSVKNWKIGYDALVASVPPVSLRKAVYDYFKSLKVPSSLKSHENIVEVIGNLLDA